MSDAAKILAAYRAIARPFIDRIFEPSTCIEQSRVLIEVLKRFGIAAEPISTKMVVTCTAKDYQFVTGLDPEEEERGKQICKSFVQKHQNNPIPRDWIVRHVVVLVERRFWVDSTLYQASTPRFNFDLDPDVIVLPLGEPLPPEYLPDLEAGYVADDGTEFTVRWIAVNDFAWQRDDGWEPSHLWPLIDRIERDMRILVRL